MVKKGPEFYDTSSVFEIYSNHRKSCNTPNETLEQPILWDLIGDPKGYRILDLGCGDGRISQKFKARGAKSYIGVDGSQLMVEQAKKNMEPGFSDVQMAWLEEYAPPVDAFDLVISSLALHYIEDIRTLIKKVYQSLKAGGQFIFSVEHPVITSCNRSLEQTDIRQDWIVDDYFIRGARDITWMGEQVTIYHRTVEDFLKALTEAGFMLGRFRESDPESLHFQDQETYMRRRRIPLFLILEGING